MKKYFKSLLVVLLCVCELFTGCGVSDLGNGTLTKPSSSNASEEFDALTQKWFREQMSEDLLSCHFSIENPSSYKISTEESTFSELSYHAFQQSQKNKRAFLKELKSISYRNLPHRSQLVYDILCHYYSLQCDFDDSYYYGDPLSPNSGVPASLPVLLSTYRFNNKEDIQDYFRLLDDVDIYFQQLFLFAKEKNQKGLLGDDLCLKETASFCKEFGQTKTDHMLLTSFQERITPCDFLSSSEKRKYISKNKALVCDVVIPSYLSLSEKISSLNINDPSDLSLCRRPDGHRYYRTLIKCATGCDDTPFLLYQRIEKKRSEDMEHLTSLFASYPSLATTISNYDCPLETPEEMIDVLKSSMENDFPGMEEISLEIQKISPQVESYSAPAFYLIAPLDNLNCHRIFYSTSSYPHSLDLFTTMAHEGFPGHLYQTYQSYRSGYEPVRLLLSYPGYVEGWATYVEMESYQYAGLPFEAATALSLNQSITLSLYATADIGIHFYGWTQEELLQFLKGYGIGDKTTASKIYQLILADPANYLKYYVGYLNFTDLKKECQEKYPDTFTPMNFHKYILQTGPCSFPILKKELFYQFDNNA